MRWLLGALSVGFAAAAIAVAASCGSEDEPARTATARTAAPSQVERGRTVFARMGCGGCHHLSGSGSGAEFSTGMAPDLDAALRGKTRAVLREDITDPLASPEGQAGEFGTMPTDFEQRMKPGELDALMDYLLSTTRQ